MSIYLGESAYGSQPYSSPSSLQDSGAGLSFGQLLFGDFPVGLRVPTSPTWQVNAQLTDGELLQITPSMAFRFGGPSFGDDVGLDAYASSTHIVDAISETHICSSVHVNATTFIDSTHVSVNGGPSQMITPTSPLRSEVPLRVSFVSPSTLTISNVSVQAVAANSSVSLYGVQVWMLEQGTGSPWRDISRSPVQLTPHSDSRQFDWWLGLSASPQSSNDKLFGLRFNLTWEVR